MKPKPTPPTFDGDRFEHGTRARYVARCRCAACRRANVEYYHRRQAAKAEAAAGVTPSGPPGQGTIARGGVQHHVRTCPGAGGASCVRSPAAWLRGKHDVCGACVERATVWNGNVPIGPVRNHLIQLGLAGVGYKSVSDACDVARSTLTRILAGEGTIRAITAKRILAVDAGARADGAVASRADAARALRLVGSLVEEGFRRGELALLLGSHTENLQIGRTGAMLASTVAAVDRLWRRWERGDLEPRSWAASAAPARRGDD